MPEAADTAIVPAEPASRLTTAPTRTTDDLESAPGGGFKLVHSAAFGLLLAALVLALALPALAAPRGKRAADAQSPASASALAAALAAPAAPPTALALALLDAAIADDRLADARNLIAPMWASGTPEVLLRGAELALAGDSLPEAAEAFAGLADGPLAARAAQGMGITLLRQGRSADARAELQKAVAIDAGMARAWSALGVLADKSRDWPAADAAYARAVAAAPQDGAILANRGWSQLLRGHHVGAERDLAAALQLQPGLKIARTNLALARAMQGRYQEAFVMSNKATLASDLNTVGFAAMSRGDLSVAEAYFNRALSLSPQFDRTAWANLQYLAELKARKVREPTGEPAPVKP